MLIDAMRYWTSRNRQPTGAQPQTSIPMPSRLNDSHTRSVVKAVSWRILGSLDTFLITWLITGSAKSAGSVASIETLSKIFLYYLHERAWSKVAFGAKPNTTPDRDDNATANEDAMSGPLADGRLWVARPFVGEIARNTFRSPHSHHSQPLVPAAHDAAPKLAVTEGAN
jgi:uncharacterized membrane protein